MMKKILLLITVLFSLNVFGQVPFMMKKGIIELTGPTVDL